MLQDTLGNRKVLRFHTFLEHVTILLYKTPKNKKNAFWGTSGCCKGTIC